MAEWQHANLQEADLGRHFPPDHGVGLLLGHDGLVDVDLDCREAREVGSALLPATGMKHGRKGSGVSHYWYQVPGEAPPPRKYVDPIDRACLVELRSHGQQTNVPPTIHPSGDELVWATQGLPSQQEFLEDRVALVAAATLLAKHWPGEGSRHDAALALSGALRNTGLGFPEAQTVLLAVLNVVGDEERADRVRALLDTYQREGDTQGWPTLAQLMPKAAVDTAAQWLGANTTTLPIAACQHCGTTPADPLREALRTIAADDVEAPELLRRVEQLVRLNSGSREVERVDGVSFYQLADIITAGPADRGTRIPYPYRALQEAYDGYGAGQLIVIAGYEGDGKSIMGLQMALKACEEGKRVGYFSLEMPVEQIAERITSMKTAVLGKRLRSGDLIGIQRERIAEAAQQVSGFNGKVYGGAMSVDQIIAEQVAEQFDLIIVDHIHRWGTDLAVIEPAIRKLKNVALDTGCASVALSQLSRRDGLDKFKYGGYSQPVMVQLRGSAAIGQEADVVIFVWRERDYKTGDKNEFARIIVGKHRESGEIPAVLMEFNAACVAYDEIGVAA